MKAALSAPERLRVRTVPVGFSNSALSNGATSADDLIGWLPNSGAHAWVRHGEGLVGWGEAARTVVPAGEDRFAWAGRWLRSLFGTADIEDPLGIPGSGPVAFGSFSFDPRLGRSVLVVPRAVMGRRDGVSWFTTFGESSDPLSMASPPEHPRGISWSDGTLTAPGWQRAVSSAVGRIKAGEASKVVLARDLLASASEPFDDRVLLRRLARRYPGCYTFACDGLIGATPELLVRRSADQVESLVLAGTIPRGSSPADDNARQAALLASAKDREEHAYAAEMVRDALHPLCASLSLPRDPAILSLPNVFHLATRVLGKLGGERSVLDVVEALHPTPAVGGTPTEAALELIRELEVMDRGRYAGPVGWIDARGDGEWAIALRCAQIDGAQARLFAGCGIVADSDPEAELAEAEAKFRVMRYALEG